jgi:pyruvate,water dikinase
VDEWYAIHSWRLVTSDDVDRPTLAEMPGVVLALLLAAQEPQSQAAPDGSALRARVPAEQRPLFDALVTEARYGLRQRDDIRGICWNWPGGLVRRALLEAGARLVELGLLQTVEHVVELSPDELAALLTTGAGPSPDDLAGRAAWRDTVEAAPPPRTLGEPEAPPPFAALPAPMRRATQALLASLMADGSAPDNGALQGTGVGTATYRGRACVVDDDLTTLDRLEPGDVLVARCTGPAFNSFVPLLGALVVEEGGAMCHAAIVAREFGLPAVIGAAGAMTSITDGALVEVDAAKGAVTLV